MDANTQRPTSPPEVLALRRLASALLLRAIIDSNHSKQEAVRWLASTKAETYFDFLDLPQSRVLSHCGWMDVAGEFPEDELISHTLEYLHELQT